MADPNVLKIDEGLFVYPTFMPAIITWNRLEGRPRRVDFDRALKAEIRDPLWMLCRQWQFGEYRGEDTGSAVKAKVQIETARINRYAPAENPARPYDDNIPLEVRVEREALPFTLSLRVQIGHHFSRLVADLWTTVRDDYISQYPIESPAAGSEEEAQLASDVKASAYHAAVVKRVVDGKKLLDAIYDETHGAFVDNLEIDDAQKDTLRETATKLNNWFERLYSTPGANETVPWRPSRLEYRFACSAPSLEGKQTVLPAEEYPGGHLDWPAFDIDLRDGAALADAENEEIPPSEAILSDPISFLPAPIEYGGMPDVRWWKFEDRKTDFGEIRASTTDLALLMLAEFGLIYGNDWSLLPYDLEVGSLARVLGVVVTDVFGVRTFVKRAGTRDDDGWQHWNMYDLKNQDPEGGVVSHMLLPPAVGQRDEGNPIEEIILARDEMANMVFGVEMTIPGHIGDGVGGPEAAAALKSYFAEHGADAGAAAADAVETGAKIGYVVGTTVPENWIPFLPTHLPGSESQIRLQRGRMARVAAGAPRDWVEPRGHILRFGLDENTPYFIHEEEVPRAGLHVKRSFQRCRWFDGRVFTWLGRSKKPGRGEGASGLRFDQIAPREPEAPTPPEPNGPTGPDDPAPPDN